MTKKDAKSLAIIIMNEWGLIKKGWTFGFNKRKLTIGVCKMSRMRIEISEEYLKILSPAEIIDTIKHEVAHAMDFLDRGTTDHGPRWKAWAVKVGCKPNRCANVAAPEGKYKAVCPTHGDVGKFYRRPRRNYVCKECRTPLEIVKN